MKIIEIEGLDKSGKHTLVKDLEKWLSDNNKKVKVVDFHDYSTPTGKEIRRILDGKVDYPTTVVESLMLVNKLEKESQYKQWESEGVDYVLLDRYIGSQICYVKPNTDRLWLLNLVRCLRKPDYSILIDIPSEVSMSRKGKWGENDIYESSKTLLDSTRKNYLQLYENTDRAYVVYSNGTKTQEQIKEEVMEYFKSEIL